MYVASPHSGSGTTRLHKDTTAAVNIMVFCGPHHEDKSLSGASWCIFMACDAEKLSAYLCKTRNIANNDPDPIHQQMIFLTEDDLHGLWRDHQIRPFQFTQKARQAVFIPPGAAHQAC